MPRRDDKRMQRELKRSIKRAGNKRRRKSLKEDLHKNPEEAAHSEVDLGRYSSETLNGMDNDATRKRDTENE
jgi:hypothetical protein